MHLVSPRRPETGIDSFGTKLKKFFSHPTGERAFLFSLFYGMAVSFPYVVALVYWTILVPARKIDGKSFHGAVLAARTLKILILVEQLTIFSATASCRPSQYSISTSWALL